jgi:hypothetical protein
VLGPVVPVYAVDKLPDQLLVYVVIQENDVRTKPQGPHDALSAVEAKIYDELFVIQAHQFSVHTPQCHRIVSYQQHIIRLIHLVFTAIACSGCRHSICILSIINPV